VFIDDATLKANIPAHIVDAMTNQYGEAHNKIVAQVNQIITRITGLQPDLADDQTLADIQLYGAWIYEYLTAGFRGYHADQLRELRAKYNDAQKQLADITAPVDANYATGGVITKNTERLGALL